MNPDNELTRPSSAVEALRRMQEEVSQTMNESMMQRIRDTRPDHAIIEEVSNMDWDVHPDLRRRHEQNTSKIKKRMKERHFNQDERQMNHNPGNDWCENKRGEKCYNSVSLEVADIVGKYA